MRCAARRQQPHAAASRARPSSATLGRAPPSGLPSGRGRPAERHCLVSPLATAGLIFGGRGGWAHGLPCIAAGGRPRHPAVSLVHGARPGRGEGGVQEGRPRLYSHGCGRRCAGRRIPSVRPSLARSPGIHAAQRGGGRRGGRLQRALRLAAGKHPRGLHAPAPELLRLSCAPACLPAPEAPCWRARGCVLRSQPSQSGRLAPRLLPPGKSPSAPAAARARPGPIEGPGCAP
jgi:hypothetical protein